MEIKHLIAIIEAAFDGVAQPDDITLHVAEAHDDYDYRNDLHRKKDYIGRWQDVPEAHIQECQNALSYVDKFGMRFYLPAYMVWYLRHWDSDVVRTDNTLYALANHSNDSQLSAYHNERFSLFTPVQLHACALFVKFFAETGLTDEYFAQKTYEGYWFRYIEPNIE